MAGTIQAGGATSRHWRDVIRVPGLETDTGIAAFEGGAMIALGAALFWAANSDKPGETTLVALAGLAAATLGWLLFQGARLMRVFRRQSATGAVKLTPEKRRLLMTEMFVWLAVSLCGLAALVMTKPEPGALAGLELTDAQIAVTLIVLMAVAFVPAVIGVLQTERQTAQSRADKRILRDDAISAGSLVFALFAMVLIVSLAWAAAHDAFSALGPNMGVVTTLFVMFAFVFFIVLSSVTRGFNVFQERGTAPKPAAFGPAASLTTLASWADSILVRILAPLTGAVQAPDGRHGLGWHHALIIGILAPLTLLGFGLPQPWGLVPIGAAFLFALAIGRRWAWVEGDRETASRLRTTKGKDIHVGFSNDLRDEALLGYSFLFVLVPLTLFQLNEMTGAFCLRGEVVNGSAACMMTQAQGKFEDWIAFFGLELLKAVPLVDWVEIYGLNVEPKLMPTPNLDVAQHLMFGSRVLVDFVVMAALFQAIAIFQRNQTQRKLYDSGQLDVLDPISEEDFFETGMIKATQAQYESWMKLTPKEQSKNPVIDIGKGNYFTAKSGFVARVENHVTEQRTAGMPWPYDRNRLNELVRDPRPDLQAGARWMIRKYGLLAGNPRNQVGQLADRWLHLNIAAARDDVVFVEKQNFEDVVKSAQSTPRDFSNAELGRLASLMIETCNRPEFAFAHIQAFKLIGMLRTRNAVLLIAASVLKPEQVEADEVWRNEVPSTFPLHWRRLRQGQDEMRVHAYAALEAMAQSGLKYPAYGVGASTYRLALRLAEQAAETEAARSRQKAAAALEAIRKVLGTSPVEAETEDA